MNALVKKEIRLLLPSWLAILSLATILPWVWINDGSIIEMSPAVLFFGAILIAVDSFGREFSLGTFSSLMSQPVERRKIWRNKITLLVVGVAVLFIAQLTSYEIWFHCWLPISGSQHWIEPGEDWWMWVGTSATLTLVGLSGGLWTTLLLRQVAAAFWISFLAPAGLLMLIMFFLPAKSSVEITEVVLYSAAGVYIASSFWLAHRLFYRAQDAAWTGGIISFSTWRYFESGSKSSVSTRHQKPVVALVKKEFQLQSISLFCAAALLVLHIAVIVMRKFHGHFERDSVASVASEFFWALWLVMPLIIGCTVVAEERRLGVTEEQFCLPASRRLQFALKFFPAILFGALLGGFMPLLLERMAAFIGAPNPDLHFTSDDFIPINAITGLALGLSLASFFASTLAKNFLQAMGAAVATIIGCCLFTLFIRNLHFFYFFMGVAWNPRLTIGVAVLTVLVTAPLLSYYNFKYVQERGRVWRRNVYGLTSAVLFIFIFSAALYNRAWEFFEPAEPSHGAAKFSLANPPIIHQANYNDVLVQLPDGRVWYDQIGYHPEQNSLREEIRKNINPFSSSIGPERFLAGSNWSSAVVRHIDEYRDQSTHIAAYLETVGIQSDGTLWVSDKPDSQFWIEDKLKKFGNETNWQALSSSGSPFSVLLLKKDGTLWHWGTNYYDWHKWPTNLPALRDFSPRQVGTNSDWKEISFNNNYMQKNDGSIWSVSLEHFIQKTDGSLGPIRRERIIRETNFDQIDLQKLSWRQGYGTGAYVRKDGTLWICGDLRWKDSHSLGFETFQTGKETNWVSATARGWRMVALKSDGTLWQKDWSFDPRSADVLTAPPTRLGIHNDWVAITEAEDGVTALAADGSLWFWPNRINYEYLQPLLKLPKQPEFLGNIFSKEN